MAKVMDLFIEHGLINPSKSDWLALFPSALGVINLSYRPVHCFSNGFGRLNVPIDP